MPPPFPLLLQGIHNHGRGIQRLQRAHTDPKNWDRPRGLQHHQPRGRLQSRSDVQSRPGFCKASEVQARHNQRKRERTELADRHGVVRSRVQRLSWGWSLSSPPSPWRSTNHGFRIYKVISTMVLKLEHSESEIFML